VINAGRATIYQWLTAHPIFADAKDRAFSKSRLFWEQIGIDGLMLQGNSRFNATVWALNMKNRFGWRENREVEDTSRISSVRIELPHAGKEQVIEMRPNMLEGDVDEST
jgi:hypothetical protein